VADVLIIDDNEKMCDVLSRKVRRMGHESTHVFTLQDGLKEAASGTFDVIFLDVRLPDGNGLDVLPQLRQTPSSPEVIIITAQGDPDGAELAIKNGAWDYVEKPSSLQAMTLPLARALQYREEKTARKPPVVLKRENIVGNSPQIRDCLDLVAQAANSDANVLITGDTGTGKELFARAIHDNSPRASRRFVVVDCTALPKTLVESLLFGHTKGAFTGADKAELGLMKQADGGTLFLDEVGELALSIQKVFLRALQEHRFLPVGGKKEVESDFRLIAATNRDLDQMTRSGRFRDDLLFRLRSLTIQLPPLRERIEDIRAIAMHHVAQFCNRHGVGTKGFSPDFLEALALYSWPGNVRELLNVLERVLTMTGDDPILFPKHLPTYIRIQVAQASFAQPAPPKGNVRQTADHSNSLPTLRGFRRAAIAKAEKQYLHDLIALTQGHIKEASRISGIARARLYELLKKHNISRAN
jgi:two-component system NtrC family response regulator